ncbi:MAG TPA: ribosome maturation factor RimP [Acidimicrobiia bacterium]
MTTQTEQLWGLIEPYLAAERLELDDLELVGQGRGRVLRVFVDGENLDIDRLADVSGGISRLLDAESDLEGSYQLEVSSPGLERKLKRPAHYIKSVGREVVVKLDRDGQTVTRRGVITGATEDGFTIAGEDGESTVDYAQVKSARTVFRLEKAPKPGHARSER